MRPTVPMPYVGTVEAAHISCLYPARPPERLHIPCRPFWRRTGARATSGAASGNRSSTLQPKQLIDEDGCCDRAALEAVLTGGGLEAAGGRYQTVAIMGPQNSGKSTALNALVSFALHGTSELTPSRLAAHCCPNVVHAEV